jgi:hypothetical protein
MVVTGAPIILPERKYEHFQMWINDYAIPLHAMEDRRHLPRFLGLRGFKLPGRTKITKTYEEWAKAVFDARRKNMLENGTAFYVEADTTTTRGHKHVMCAIVRYYDKVKKKQKRWCFNFGARRSEIDRCEGGGVSRALVQNRRVPTVGFHQRFGC